MEKAKGLVWTAKTEQASANLSKSIDYAPLDMPVAEAEAALANARALGVLEEDEDEMVAAKVAEAKLAQAEKNLAGFSAWLVSGALARPNQGAAGEA